MIGTLASHMLDAIRDHLHLHVGFCRWSDDLGELFLCPLRSRRQRAALGGPAPFVARLRELRPEIRPESATIALPSHGLCLKPGVASGRLANAHPSRPGYGRLFPSFFAWEGLTEIVAS